MWFGTYCTGLEKELRVKAVQTSFIVAPSKGQLAPQRHVCPSPPNSVDQEHFLYSGCTLQSPREL